MKHNGTITLEDWKHVRGGVRVRDLLYTQFTFPAPEIGTVTSAGVVVKRFKFKIKSADTTIDNVVVAGKKLGTYQYDEEVELWRRGSEILYPLYNVEDLVSLISRHQRNLVMSTVRGGTFGSRVSWKIVAKSQYSWSNDPSYTESGDDLIELLWKIAVKCVGGTLYERRPRSTT